MQRRDIRFDSPSTYAGYLETTGRIADPSVRESVWLPEQDLVGIYRCLEEADRKSADATESRARQFIATLAAELARLESAATASGDESILYSPPYTRALKLVRSLRAPGSGK